MSAKVADHRAARSTTHCDHHLAQEAPMADEQPINADNDAPDHVGFDTRTRDGWLDAWATR